jgi:hypothetical protein
MNVNWQWLYTIYCGNCKAFYARTIIPFYQNKKKTIGGTNYYRILRMGNSIKFHIQG